MRLCKKSWVTLQANPQPKVFSKDAGLPACAVRHSPLSWQKLKRIEPSLLNFVTAVSVKNVNTV
jgi:hypothetical protein